MLLITVVSMLAIAGLVLYIITRNWSPALLWLKYLAGLILLNIVIGVVGYMPIRLRANDEKIDSHPHS